MIRSSGPFDTIESAQEFMALLGEQVDRAADEVRHELGAIVEGRHERRRDAWRLVLYKVTTLSTHVATSRRLLHDLRTLRNLLHRNGGDDEERDRRPDADTAGNRATISPAEEAT